MVVFVAVGFVAMFVAVVYVVLFAVVLVVSVMLGGGGGGGGVSWWWTWWWCGDGGDGGARDGGGRGVVVVGGGGDGGGGGVVCVVVCGHVRGGGGGGRMGMEGGAWLFRVQFVHVNESHVVGVCGVGTKAPSGRASLCDRWEIGTKIVESFYIEKTLKTKNARFLLPNIHIKVLV